MARTLPRLLPPVLVRPRLEDRLDDWAPVTVVQGAQGFGKSTVVASWLRRRGGGVLPLWINVTPHLADRESLLGYVNQRVGRLIGDERRQNEPAPSSFDECLFRLPGDRTVALVLDDSHLLTDQSLKDELVTLPQHHDNLHLLLCTHNLFIPSLVGYGASLNVITPGELLFTAEESAQLADLLGRPVTGETVGAVQQAVGGWAALVRLALESDDGLAAADAYLRYRVLPALADEPGFKALMRLSLAEHLHFDLASDLDAFGILRAFEQSGLVQRRLTADKPEFTFPTLIRNVLKDSFTSADPTEARAFHHQLALHFAAKGIDGAASAFRHAVAARDLPLALRVWAEHGMVLGTVDPGSLLDPILTLTSAELAPYPSLRVAAASLAALGHARPDDAEQPAMRAYYEACEQALLEDTEHWSAPDLLFIGTGHLIGLRSRGELQQAADLGDSMAARVTTDAVIEDVFRWQWSCFYYHLGLTHTMLGEHEQAMDNYRISWGHDVGADAPYFARFSASNLALTHAVRGDRTQALRWMKAASDLHASPGGWIDEIGGPGAGIARGILALDDGDLTSLGTLCGELDAQAGHPELWPFTAYLRAQNGLHHGDPAEALIALDAAIEAHNREPTGPVMAQTLLLRPRLDLLIAAGAGQRARDLLPAGSGGHPLLGIVAARIHLMTGEPVRARAITTRLLNNHPAPRERLELLLILAAAALRMNDQPAAIHNLVTAQALALHNGMQRAFAAWDSNQELALPETGPGSSPTQARSIYPKTLTLISLTDREWTLLDALANNVTRQQIAAQLFVSLNTIKTQLGGLYNKLDVKTREEALLKAGHLGLQRITTTG